MHKLHMNAAKMTVLAIVCIAFSGLAYADDIADSINEALQYYKNGEYTDAVGSLDYATQLIKQKKGGQLESLLPKPLKGWIAEDATSQVAGAALFGGGVTAERKYRKDSSSITVQLTTDSPMMQGVMMMFTNPMFAASDGGKMEKIGGQKAIVKYNAANKQGDIKIMLGNRFLVSIEGNGVAKEDLKGYAEAIEYNKMASLP